MRFELLESKLANLQWMLWTDNVLRKQFGMLEKLASGGREDDETVAVVIVVTVLADIVVIVDVLVIFRSLSSSQC